MTLPNGTCIAFHGNLSPGVIRSTVSQTQDLKHVFTELPRATCVEDIEALRPFKSKLKPKNELEPAA